MGRLEDIADRNRRANDPKRGAVGMAIAEFQQAFDPTIPVHERRTKQIALGVIALLVAGAVAAYLLWPRGGAPGGKVRARSGETIELSSLWENRRVVVVFYPGKGCDSCTFILEELEKHRGELDADVIAISSHSASHAEQLHERLKLGFEIYVDPTFQVIPKWGVPFVLADATGNALFVVEPGGKISYKEIGSFPEWSKLAALTHPGGSTQGRQR